MTTSAPKILRKQLGRGPTKDEAKEFQKRRREARKARGEAKTRSILRNQLQREPTEKNIKEFQNRVKKERKDAKKQRQMSRARLVLGREPTTQDMQNLRWQKKLQNHTQRISMLRERLNREPDEDEIKHFGQTMKKEKARRAAILRVQLNREPTRREINQSLKAPEAQAGFGGAVAGSGGNDLKRSERVEPMFERVVIGSDSEDEDEDDDLDSEFLESWENLAVDDAEMTDVFDSGGGKSLSDSMAACMVEEMMGGRSYFS